MGVLLATVMLLHACRKDPGPDAPGGVGAYVPTPFELQVPEWSITPMHYPHVPYDNPTTVEGIALGRKLFHETALSDDYSLSCASCHVQANAFSDPRRFSMGTDGSVGTRNSMAVMNMAWDMFFFWDARALSMELQALEPVVDHAEMRNTWPVVEQRLREHPEYPELFRKAFGTPGIDSLRVVFAIAQFERTFISLDSRFDRWYYGGDASALTAQEQRGFELFIGDASCSGCHMLPMFTDHSARNNGLDLIPIDGGIGAITGLQWHMGQFKTTSLRNIEVTAPYMHDGRFATLEEVMDFYAEGVQTQASNLDNHMQPWVLGLVQLDAQDRADLVAFMRTLTDETFLTNPAFGPPE